MRQSYIGRAIAVCIAILLIASAGSALAADDVRHGPAPDWALVATQTATDAPPSGSDGLRMMLFDQQVHADGQSTATYFRYRSQALSPQALPLLGSVTLAWSPASQDVTVHHVTIIRNGQAIDAMDGRAFETLRREQNLEQAVLDGMMTAVLQLSGLRIGDTLDVAYTTTSRDPVTGGHFEQVVDLNLPTTVDRIRYRASWPASLAVRAQAYDDWTPITVRRVGGRSVLEIDMDKAQPIILPDGVPTRFMEPRRIELTDYRDWSDIAVVMKPLYDTARRPAADSPLHAEISRIRALSEDPAVQAAAALRLVQDQIRYVALMMGPGGLTPATADETWDRRFGDCKAKTALLLALLDGLGIEAVPAIVSTRYGDDLDQRLPTIASFDHVLVRAVIEGRTYWLDGTRTGDRGLETIQVPLFHWALPVTGPQARLEPLATQPPSEPYNDAIFALDASAGLRVPATVEGTLIIRGEAAAVLGGQFALVTDAQKEIGLRNLWSIQMYEATITEVASFYDVQANSLTLTMKGTVVLGWGYEGVILPGTLYQSPSAVQRPAGPFQDAPYSIVHPSYTRQTTTLRLPAGGRGFRISGGEVDRSELGHHIRRTTTLDGDRVTVEVTTRSLASEITAADAMRDQAASEARPSDRPLVFPPENYRLSEADRAAVAAERPTTADDWMSQAFILSSSGDFEGAEAAANEAVTLEPESSSALANRGVYRLMMGNLEGAEADLEKAADIDPSERIAMNGHAMLAMSRGEYQDAVVELSRALRQAPNDAFALTMRAQAYRSLKQYDRSLRDIDALIATQPGAVRTQLLRIGLLMAAERADEAEAEMDALVAADPSVLGVRLNQAALKLRRGKAEESRTILDDLLATLSQPEPPADASPELKTNVLMTRARALIALGLLDEAAQDFATIRDASPNEADVLNDLCWTAAVSGALLDQALRDCDAALAIAPTEDAFLDSRARVLLQQGKAAEALAIYDAILSQNPKFASPLYARGLAHIALGSIEAGEADKAAALAMDPEVIHSYTSYSPPASAPPT